MVLTFMVRLIISRSFRPCCVCFSHLCFLLYFPARVVGLIWPQSHPLCFLLAEARHLLRGQGGFLVMWVGKGLRLPNNTDKLNCACIIL